MKLVQIMRKQLLVSYAGQPQFTPEKYYTDYTCNNYIQHRIN